MPTFEDRFATRRQPCGCEPTLRQSTALPLGATGCLRTGSVGVAGHAWVAAKAETSSCATGEARSLRLGRAYNEAEPGGDEPAGEQRRSCVGIERWSPRDQSRSSDARVRRSRLSRWRARRLLRVANWLWSAGEAERFLNIAQMLEGARRPREVESPRVGSMAIMSVCQ